MKKSTMWQYYCGSSANACGAFHNWVGKEGQHRSTYTVGKFFTLSQGYSVPRGTKNEKEIWDFEIKTAQIVLM